MVQRIEQSLYINIQYDVRLVNACISMGKTNLMLMVYGWSHSNAMTISVSLHCQTFECTFKRHLH